MSMGVLMTPGFGVSAIVKAGGAHGYAEFENSMGLFNCCWAAMFLLFLIVAIKTNIFMVLIFACVSTTCLLMGISSFCNASHNKATGDVLQRIAGVFLLVSSIPNWYLLFLILAASAGWQIRMPTGDLGAHKHAHAPPPSKKD